MQGKRTPLHYAAYRGNSETANILIEAGASLDPIDKVSISII